MSFFVLTSLELLLTIWCLRAFEMNELELILTHSYCLKPIWCISCCHQLMNLYHVAL